jgi:hypothetical protein
VGNVTIVADKRDAYKVWSGDRSEGDHVENLELIMRYNFKILLAKWPEGLDWIILIQVRDQ